VERKSTFMNLTCRIPPRLAMRNVSPTQIKPYMAAMTLEMVASRSSDMLVLRITATMSLNVTAAKEFKPELIVLKNKSCYYQK